MELYNSLWTLFVLDDVIVIKADEQSFCLVLLKEQFV